MNTPELGPEFDPVTLTEHVDATLAAFGMTRILRRADESDESFDRRMREADNAAVQTARAAVRRRRLGAG